VHAHLARKANTPARHRQLRVRLALVVQTPPQACLIVPIAGLADTVHTPELRYAKRALQVNTAMKHAAQVTVMCALQEGTVS
jgi:hypothetical protein